MKSAWPSVLLFDLGGVLVENATFRELPALLPYALDAGDLQDRWLESAAVQEFERGRTTAEEFSVAFVEEWRLELSPELFLPIFASWPKGPFEGALELLEQLRGAFVIAVLSNCNSIHWQMMQHIINRTNRAFSSHQFGIVKPDPEIFDRVVEELDCAPGEICFFDDSMRNVNAARNCGITAFRTVGFEALRDMIFSLEYLRKPS